jgi:AbrB family looped-hinge helix DNA binding protein
MKLSSKYQVVIPEGVREALDLKPGAEIEVIAKGGIAYLVPVKSASELRSALKGKLGKVDRTAIRDKKDRI